MDMLRSAASGYSAYYIVRNPVQITQHKALSSPAAATSQDRRIHFIQITYNEEDRETKKAANREWKLLVSLYSMISSIVTTSTIAAYYMYEYNSWWWKGAPTFASHRSRVPIGDAVKFLGITETSLIWRESEKLPWMKNSGSINTSRLRRLYRTSWSSSASLRVV